VLKLHISYAVCAPIRPQFVITQDSGSYRDQSDANRTAGAIVEAFVPMAEMLRRLSTGPAAAPSAGHADERTCGCAQDGTASATASSSATTDFASGSFHRAILVGVDATLADAPVNLLMLVDEHNHDQLAPLAVDAIVADRFTPIVADDSTRALGESGVLSMAFSVSPTSRELFGRTLAWLRLRPTRQPDAEWMPTVRGVYLNAVWASATETLTRELLGSSEGAPNLTFTLQRPPLLRNSLELRVKEPLSDEEREGLRLQGTDRVIADESLPGDWVLWRQVIDPLDEGPRERVYAHDEATGVVRFGDGLHGMIPPVGRDSIVAFKYQRTEVGEAGGNTVAANTIRARTPLNLISPVESVEAVFAADGAAGGASAESDARVLRFGFARVRHRNRGVTLRDLEDLALQSSPDIVQASAEVRDGTVRMTIVMRGDQPSPTAQQIRELKRLLLDQSPTALAAANALRIAGPRERRVQIDIDAVVPTLDRAGAVGREIKARVARLFDTATGGITGDGWPLGVTPTAEDVAFALLDTAGLESVTRVEINEVDRDGRIRPVSSPLRPTELALLASDPLRLTFATSEVSA
jgi:hypothetical protein